MTRASFLRCADDKFVSGGDAQTDSTGVLIASGSPLRSGHVSDVMAGLERLLQRLCQTLETHQMGARRLRLTARRVDSAHARTEIALARPGRDPARIRALFEPGQL